MTGKIEIKIELQKYSNSYFAFKNILLFLEIRLKATFHNASEPQAVWINTADVLRCNNNNQSYYATLLPITAQRRLQIIKVVIRSQF